MECARGPSREPRRPTTSRSRRNARGRARRKSHRIVHRALSRAPVSRRAPTTPPRTPDTWRVAVRRRTSSPAHPCSRRCVARRGRRRRRARDRESRRGGSEAASCVSSCDSSTRVRSSSAFASSRASSSVSHRAFTFRSIVRLARLSFIHWSRTASFVCARARDARDVRANGRLDKCPRASTRPRVHARVSVTRTRAMPTDRHRPPAPPRPATRAAPLIFLALPRARSGRDRSGPVGTGRDRSGPVARAIVPSVPRRMGVRGRQACGT